MAKIDIRRSLIEWAKDTQTLIKDRIVMTDTIDTGALLKSIRYINPEYGGSQRKWFIDFEMLDYGKYTDEYNPRVKKEPVPPRNFFKESIKVMGERLEEYIDEEIDREITGLLVDTTNKKYRKR